MSAPMQKQWAIYHGRLQRFLSRDYAPEMNITSCLVTQRWSEGISVGVWTPPPLDPPPASDDSHIPFGTAKDAAYRPAGVGHVFGPSWSTHWFRITVPPRPSAADWHFYWQSEAEGLVWTEDGRAVHGLSPQDRSDFPLDLVAQPDTNDPVVFYIEMACNGMFGNGDPDAISPPNDQRTFVLSACELREYNPRALSLYYDLQILQDLIATRGEGTPIARRALFAANSIINHFSIDRLDQSLEACQGVADDFFHRHFHRPQPPSLARITAVGNCHIDTAWLWRYRETRRKTARSWSSQLALLQRHPHITFAIPQMQQLEWLRSDYPELFDRVKAAQRKGRFIPIGGTWVEMDGNLPSGESFARQFLYGQKFMMEHFGAPSEIFWLPDTFGYHAQLPQLMSKAGIKYFVTQKLSWNNINPSPHTSFWWEGIDGTRVLAHFPPSNTYTAQATAGEVIRSETDHKDIERSREALLLYGHGDGGGGPTEAMISRLEKMNKSAGIFAEICFSTPLEFFRRLEGDAADLLRWRGELYFELHRGTYTSQAQAKFYNRRCETFLREAEMLSVISGVVSNALVDDYPANELESLWKGVLLNQFHDVLPGSSIASVYKDATKIYQNVEYRAAKIRDDAMNWLFGNRIGSGRSSAGDGDGDGDGDGEDKDKGIVFFNTTPYPREEVLLVPYDGAGRDGGEPQPGVLAIAGIQGLAMASLAQTRVPMTPTSHGDRSVVLARVEEGGQSSRYVMENQFVRVHVDERGHITSFFDKELDREIIDSSGEKRGNRLMLYEDLPRYWDAWDVELHHLEKGRCVSEECPVQLKVEMEGPLLASLSRVVQISPDSTVTQLISLSCLSKRLDFTCRIEWHESHRLLKVDFPVTVRSETASFECPFGMVQRPTHMNTSWDVARFEVCGHRFADLSEADYGVALLNDCKYGYSVRDSLMQLSLLRSPKFPDDTCDMGEHVMRFALFPHQGTAATGDVVAEAIKFNTPLLWTSASPAKYDDRWLNQSVFSFHWQEGGAERNGLPLAIDAIKLAEDQSGDIIVRAYEPRGCRGVAVLAVHPLLCLSTLRFCDLLERDVGELQMDEEGRCIVPFTPFQIVSLRTRIQLGPDAHPMPLQSPRHASDRSDPLRLSFVNIPSS